MSFSTATGSIEAVVFRSEYAECSERWWGSASSPIFSARRSTEKAPCREVMPAGLAAMSKSAVEGCRFVVAKACSSAVLSWGRLPPCDVSCSL